MNVCDQRYIVMTSKAGNIDLQINILHLPQKSLEHVVGQKNTMKWCPFDRWQEKILQQPVRSRGPSEEMGRQFKGFLPSKLSNLS